MNSADNNDPYPDQPSPDLQERPTNVRWLTFGLACGTSFFLYLHRYVWNLIGPELAKEYGLSKTELGTLFSFFSPTYGFGQIPSGIVCDLLGDIGWNHAAPYLRKISLDETASSPVRAAAARRDQYLRRY